MSKRSKRQVSLTNSKIAVVGSGSWATALVKSLQMKSSNVYWWVRSQENIDFIIKHHRNPKYLRSVEINIDKDKIFTDIKEVLRDAEVVFLVIPSLFLRKSLVGLKPIDFKNKIIVSTIKGIIPRRNLLISEYLQTTFKISKENYIFLTGPTHAEEVANNRLTFITLASESESNIDKTASLLGNAFLKIRKSNDIVGLEYASIVKNIYAIALGICNSLGYGDNFQAVLISNAIKEMKLFLDAICPYQRVIMSSGYLGDLIATSVSQFSRNRTFGNMIGKGYSTRSALLEMNMIPEGYYAVRPFYRLVRKSGVKMEIVKSVYRILYKKVTPIEEFQKLETFLI